jgi:hypothetical protein
MQKYLNILQRIKPVSLGVILVLFFFYGNILKSPNSFVFTSWGDGMKNYYTYNQYIHHNESYINFEGLNYPYGEHFAYLDSYPVVSVSVKWISQWYPGIKDYSIGILNMFMITSFFVCFLFSYLVFKRLGITKTLAALAAFGIMMLTPQVERLTGHLALGNAAFFPMSMYLFMLWLTNKKNKLILVLNVCVVLFWFFVHAYLGAMLTAFFIAYWLFYFISSYRKNKRIDLKELSITLVQSLLPIVLYWIFLQVTDIHEGRTTNPWGFFATKADFRTVFLPHNPPLKDLMNFLHLKVHQNWEGWSYIGLMSTLSIFVYLFKWGKARKEKQGRKVSIHFENDLIRFAWPASLLVLAFSMALPFLLGLQMTLDWFPFLKQFRATGRFAWVFFYFVNFWSLYYLFTCSKKAQEKYRKYYLLACFLLVGFNIVEGWHGHKWISSEIQKTKNIFLTENLNEDETEIIRTIRTEDFQAIIPLPYYYIGSENYGKEANGETYRLTELMSFHLNLPVMGAHLTRTGIQESKNIYQIFSPGYYEKLVKSDIDSKKDFLILFSKKGYLNNYENDLLRRAQLILENDEAAVYSLSFDSLFQNTRKREWEQFEQVKDSLFEKNGFLVQDTNKYFLYKGFEESPSEIQRAGKGAINARINDWTTIVDLPKDELKKGKTYIASFWVYNDGKNFGQDQLNYSVTVETKRENGTLEWYSSFRLSQSMCIDGSWSLIEIPFQPKEENEAIKIFFKGSYLCKLRTVIDEFLLYEEGNTIYKQESEDLLIKNNHRIKRN